jgi:hypothetical protein
MQNGISLHHHTEKNACDGIDGTTKREVTKSSLQGPFNEQILMAKDMFEYCKENIKRIAYMYVKNEDIVIHKEKLKDRFENCQRIPGTRKYHIFVPEPENNVRCYLTSKSKEYEKFCIMKAVQLSVKHNDIVACVYDKQWWLGIIVDVSVENKDILVKFYHPAGPRTSFKMTQEDKVWLPLINVLRKLSPSELYTVTGHSYNITQSLCEEISLLLNKHPK